jgi:hypothetical protein
VDILIQTIISRKGAKKKRRKEEKKEIFFLNQCRDLAKNQILKIL